MKYNLISYNFKVRYESFKNPFHPFVPQPSFDKSHPAFANYSRLNSLQSIFDHAMIIDRKTKATLKENRKIIPVGQVQFDSDYSDKAMALECIYADIKKDNNGQSILDSNGDYILENYMFKFKNTFKDNKEIQIRPSTVP